MRVLLVVIGLALLIIIVLMSLGMIQITQTRPAQAPEFEADVGRVDLGSENRTIQVPTLDVEKPDDNQAVVTNSY